MLKAKLLAGGGAEATYVDDVFSAYTYTGNGSTQTITNGIDLSGQGGMVWSKRRDAAQNHGIFDTVNGVGVSLNSISTAAHLATSPDITSFNSDGVTYGAPGTYIYNFNGGSYVNWTFRKAPKFFDVVTWTGNGANRTIAHSLGQEVGMILVKRTDTTSAWQVYHRSLSNVQYLVLNTTAAQASDATRWNSTTATTSVFSLGTEAAVNASGGTYVAYLFAHDTGTDGIVQCGTWTGAANVNLGWEPQYVLIKSTSAIEDWYINDTSRGLTITSPSDPSLRANSSVAESTGVQIKPNATGFTTANLTNTYIYMAIRRPNKPPTVGTQVYNAIARTGTGAAATVTGVGFAPDLVVDAGRSAGYPHFWWDRLRGANKSLDNSLTNSEASPTASLNSFDQKGVTVGSDTVQYINHTGISYINHFFKRAPGVFDVVCYTGNGGTNTQSHNLGAIPELMILKGRSTPSDWGVYVGSISQMYYKLTLQTTDAAAVNNSLFSAAPTASSFTLNTTNLNNNAGTYVAYLFATKAGISKVFSYTGNGSSQTINCGFTTGARFVLIKRTDIAGDWYVWDTVRGIIAGNDPHLSLNTTAAEVTTDDSVDSDTTGFIVNQLAATNINVTSATYIGLAFA